MSNKRKPNSNSNKPVIKRPTRSQNNNRDDDSTDDDEDVVMPMFIPIIIPQAPPPLPVKSKKETVEDRIKKSGMDEQTKAFVIDKYKTGDSDKLKQWIELLLKIPFGKYASTPLNKADSALIKQTFFKEVQSNLDKAVYGMENVKEEILNYVAQFVSTNNKSSPRIIGLVGEPGIGKCFAKGTPILMFDGQVKPVEKVEVFDVIMGDDNTPRNVLALGSGRDTMYSVEHSDGNTYTVNSEHILCLKYIRKMYKIVDNDQLNKNRISVYYLDPTSLEKRSRHFYFDTCSKSQAHAEALDFCEQFDKQDILVEIRVKDFIRLPNNVKKGCRAYYVSGVDFAKKPITSDPYTLGKNLEISNDVLINTRTVRLEFLAGVIDGITSGKYFSKKGCFRVTIDKRYLEHVEFLVRSLGFGFEKYNLFNDNVTARIYGKLKEIPTKHVKVDKFFITKKQGENPLYTKFIIKQRAQDTYYGFMIDGNCRFVLGNFAVTHNTAIVRRGLSEALKRPMYCISMGGITDSNHFLGFDFTYVGSRHGKIAQALMETKVMNPILFFDELDKISKNVDGIEVENLFVHLTDPVQNHNFNDKYFTDINIDLSKAIFVFSFNDEKNINPILLDRIHMIKVPTPDLKAKTIIAQKYLLKEIAPNVGFKFEDIILPDEVVHKLIQTYCRNDKGVRGLKAKIESLLLKLNACTYLKNKKYNKIPETISFPFMFTWEQVEQLLGKEEHDSILNHLFI